MLSPKEEAEWRAEIKRRPKIAKGQRVRFAMPVKYKSKYHQIGVITSVNGAYIMLRVQGIPEKIEVERYPEELRRVGDPPWPVPKPLF